jgi:alkylation response protein AidB-like acyl-CoA dehydrogenase
MQPRVPGARADTTPVPTPVPEHRLVAAARRVADEVLIPSAADVDRNGVPPEHLAALADAGILGMCAPVEFGGSAAPAPVVRQVTELLAGACCPTWFVQAQHHAPVQRLAASVASMSVENSRRAPQAELLTDLASGRRLAGVAFSHLRRWPHRPVAATRVDGGWRFDGTAPWFTGWGLSDVVMLAAATADGEAVFGFTPGRDGAHLTASPPVRMAVLDGAQTVRLHLNGLLVADDLIVTRVPMEMWTEQDRLVTANVNPAVFGVAQRALDLLQRHAEQSGDRAAVDAERRLADRLAAVRTRAYRLLDEVEPHEAVDERLAVRADASHLAIAATTSLVVASAGRAMAADHPAQRLAREAMFLLVQAQTAEVRAATLDRWR